MKLKHWLLIGLFFILVIALGCIILRYVFMYLPYTGSGLSLEEVRFKSMIRKDTVGVIILDTPPVLSPAFFVMDEEWRYFKGVQQPPAGWNQLDFDDSDWITGKPGFGYSDNDDRTVLSDMQGNYLSLYTRVGIQIPNMDKISPLILKVDIDDGFVAYINGVEFARRNLNGEPPAFNKQAKIDNETGVPQYVTIDQNLLRTGENVLALQGHNKSANDPDFSLIASLEQNQLPIEVGDTWRYFIGTEEPPPEWLQVEFDDSNWIPGISGFGFADQDDNTRVTTMKDRYLTLYTRNDFYVQDPGQVGMLTLEIDYDDGFIAYLNGKELWRRNISAQPAAYNTRADGKHEAGEPDFIQVNPNLLLSGENTLAIQVHNESKNSSDLTLKASLRQYGPYLQNVTPDSIRILWENYTDPTLGKVRYRELGDLIWREASMIEKMNFHEIPLGSLKPNTIYQYQVHQEDFDNWIPAKPASFSTSPDAAGSYRLAVYGDSRTYHDRHANVVNSIINNDPDLVINVGDLVDAGRDYALWGTQFFGPLAELMIETPLYPAIGNHELDGPGRLWYTDFFSLPNNERWYGFTYGCSRIISLDSNIDIKPSSPQYAWLTEELASNEYKNSIWQIVVLHHPPYTSGPHESDEKPVVEYLVPLFEQYGVDFVIAGHNHHYERSHKNGVYHIVSGGGGAELYDFPNTKLNPDSQVRSEIYNHITLDFACSEEKAVFNAWNIWNQVIDGPIEIK